MLPSSFANMNIFDDKLTAQMEFRLSGGRGGSKWKKTVGNYLVGKVLTLYDILRWAESLEDYHVAVGVGTQEMTLRHFGEDLIDEDQLSSLECCL